MMIIIITACSAGSSWPDGSRDTSVSTHCGVCQISGSWKRTTQPRIAPRSWAKKQRVRQSMRRLETANGTARMHLFPPKARPGRYAFTLALRTVSSTVRTLGRRNPKTRQINGPNTLPHELEYGNSSWTMNRNEACRFLTLGTVEGPLVAQLIPTGKPHAATRSIMSRNANKCTTRGNQINVSLARRWTYALCHQSALRPLLLGFLRWIQSRKPPRYAATQNSRLHKLCSCPHGT